MVEIDCIVYLCSTRVLPPYTEWVGPTPQISPEFTLQGVTLVFYSSHFCEPCARTREVLGEVRRLLPALSIVERDIVENIDDAEIDGVRSTPTVIIRNPAGDTVVRAEGIPTLPAVLAAVSRAAEPSS